jgi:hypothetical protein
MGAVGRDGVGFSSGPRVPWLELWRECGRSWRISMIMLAVN